MASLSDVTSGQSKNLKKVSKLLERASQITYFILVLIYWWIRKKNHLWAIFWVLNPFLAMSSHPNKLWTTIFIVPSSLYCTYYWQWKKRQKALMNWQRSLSQDFCPCPAPKGWRDKEIFSGQKENGTSRPGLSRDFPQETHVASKSLLSYYIYCAVRPLLYLLMAKKEKAEGVN